MPAPRQNFSFPQHQNRSQRSSRSPLRSAQHFEAFTSRTAAMPSSKTEGSAEAALRSITTVKAEPDCSWKEINLE
ncbi:hypothetical protein E4U35_002640 [Claviceps purpurea]|nr:hypothetical protein E4U35_002640 [Claviceps purpurea]KAG6310290.1 hypothetical protein E4U44_005685 [Claviceps purpurea]